MCNACGNPAAPGHWTEAGAPAGSARRRALHRRTEILNRILKPYGYAVYTDGNIPQIQLVRPGGARIMVNDLSDLWATVERFEGQPIDPMAPRWAH